MASLMKGGVKKKLMTKEPSSSGMTYGKYDTITPIQKKKPVVRVAPKQTTSKKKK